MDTEKELNIRSRLKSFKYAFTGIYTLIREEPNAKIHLLAALAVLVAGSFCQLSLGEWAIIGFSITLVFVAEMINTALEKMCDLVTRETNPEIKKIKDIAAGAVLLCACTAVICGLCIFGPRLLLLFK